MCFFVSLAREGLFGVSEGGVGLLRHKLPPMGISEARGGRRVR